MSAYERSLQRLYILSPFARMLHEPPSSPVPPHISDLIARCFVRSAWESEVLDNWIERERIRLKLPELK